MRTLSARLGYLFLTALLVGTAALIITAPDAQAISNADRAQERPTTWAPTYVDAQLTQARSWGDVAYFMQWAGPASTVNLGNNRDEHNEFEVGYKRLPATNGCARTAGFTYSGFPNGMKLQHDYDEDSSDWVIAFFDGDYLGQDQRNNPDKIYGMWGKCNKEGGHYGSNFETYFELQLGRYAAFQCVCDSNSDASLNYIPKSQGYRGVPGVGTTNVTEVAMYAPWLVNGNAEDSDSQWHTYTADGRRYCGQGNNEQGTCHFAVAYGGGSSSWLYQDFGVANFLTSDGFAHYSRYSSGNNTGFQYEGVFRCPIPYNSGPCSVRIWLKTKASSTWQYSDYRVPRDGRYYYIMQDNYRYYGADQVVQLSLEFFNQTVDVDSQWVTGGL